MLDEKKVAKEGIHGTMLSTQIMTEFILTFI